eukprot:TRINITY_DN1298_c0_g2_i1.p1 TRINITY_DN1298_c0_g2~~TRINITY_DN1298_c0_g2_i1.p1  ORF type:complete len:514 (+),score=113.36 TRINITY_DN1298_c0_g2_i1:649-2190(+)
MGRDMGRSGWSEPSHGSRGSWNSRNPREDDARLEKELFGEAKEAGTAIQSYDIPVSTSGSDVPEPIDSFSGGQVHPAVLANIERAKYTSPTPVQRYSIPIVGAGRDLMSCAQTGSGKTAAFLVPIISNLLSNPSQPRSNSRATPRALVMSPTRELADQIFEEARKFCFKTSIRPVVCYGGASARDQISELRRGCQLLIATPGRLSDLMERGVVSMSAIEHLCLDEADRMLDMGFEPQIRRIVEKADMPYEGRQTLMFSATFPNMIQRLASDFLRDHVFLTVGITGSTTKNVTQTLEYVEDRDAKASLLLDLLVAVEGLTIVFVETKVMADELSYFLQREGFGATAIHGDRDQRERQDAIRTFKSGQTPCLVATDVASRGLDINNVAHVINFELPKDIDSYVHRIGRTARAGNKGLATSFVGRKDGKIAASLLDVLAESQQEIPDWLPGIASRGFKSSSAKGGGMWGATDARRSSQAGGAPAASYQGAHQQSVPSRPQASSNTHQKSNQYWDDY